MAKILIIYASDYGSTKKMAEFVAEGVQSVSGAESIMRGAEETTADDMIAADAVILGSPVHMGSIDWRMKKFFDTVCGGLWMKNSLNGKVGAVFATGSGYGNSGGGAELMMLAMLANLAEMGFILVPLPKNTPGYTKGGLHWGPVGRTATEELQPIGFPAEAAEAAHHHGANVARIAMELSGKKLFGE